MQNYVHFVDQLVFVEFIVIIERFHIEIDEIENSG